MAKQIDVSSKQLVNEYSPYIRLVANSNTYNETSRTATVKYTLYYCTKGYGAELATEDRVWTVRCGGKTETGRFNINNKKGASYTIKSGEFTFSYDSNGNINDSNQIHISAELDLSLYWGSNRVRIGTISTSGLLDMTKISAKNSKETVINHIVSPSSPVSGNSVTVTVNMSGNNINNMINTRSTKITYPDGTSTTSKDQVIKLGTLTKTGTYNVVTTCTDIKQVSKSFSFTVSSPSSGGGARGVSYVSAKRNNDGTVTINFGAWGSNAYIFYSSSYTYGSYNRIQSLTSSLKDYSITVSLSTGSYFYIKVATNSSGTENAKETYVGKFIGSTTTTGIPISAYDNGISFGKKYNKSTPGFQINFSNIYHNGVRSYFVSASDKEKLSKIASSVNSTVKLTYGYITTSDGFKLLYRTVTLTSNSFRTTDGNGRWFAEITFPDGGFFETTPSIIVSARSAIYAVGSAEHSRYGFKVSCWSVDSKFFTGSGSIDISYIAIGR